MVLEIAVFTIRSGEEDKIELLLDMRPEQDKPPLDHVSPQ